MKLKVNFKLADEKYDSWLIWTFLNKKNEQRKKTIFEAHPKIKEIWEKEDNKKEKIKQYVKEFYKINGNEIKEKIEKFQTEWNTINDEFLEKLQEVLEVKWFANLKEIGAYIAVTPICPRFLKQFNFSIFFRFNEKLIPISAHEITHFLYFEKWKQVFPESNEKEFESPYLIWYLSEILAPIILMNPKIINLINTQLKTNYPLLQIEGLNALEYFDKMYKESLNNHESFEVFLKKAFTKLKEYEKQYKEMIVEYY